MLPVKRVSLGTGSLLHLHVSKRSFLMTTAATVLGSFIFNENNRLADKMESGKLHYKDVNALISQQRESEDDGSLTKPVDQYPQYFKRSKPQYAGHVPLFNFERLLMIAGLSIGSYFHPERNEFIVGLGESTAFPYVLKRLQKQMLADSVGRSILREKPRITSTLLDLDYLRLLPDNTIGKTYIKWLDREGVSPDTRVPVKYIDDEELAYIFQRYRECHDFYHAITGLPIIIEGEIAVKVLEYMNIGIPMSGLGALFAPLRLKPKQKNRLYNIYYPWAMKSGLNSKPLINVYWENILERDIDEFRKEMGIEQPPDLRELRESQKKKK